MKVFEYHLTVPANQGTSCVLSDLQRLQKSPEHIPFSPVTFKSISRRLARAIMELSLENEDEMAIEIKGLRAKALAARGHLDKINAAYDKFNEAAPAHASEITKMASDLGEMQSDLEFATNLLGNSAGESEKLADAPKPGPFPSYPTTLKVAGAS